MAVAEPNIIYGNLHGSVSMGMVSRAVMDNFRGKVYVLIAAPEPGYLAASAVNRILLPMVAYLGPSFLAEFTDIMNRKGTDINILKNFINSLIFTKLYRHWAYLQVSIEYIIDLHENISEVQRRGMSFPLLPIFSVYTKKYPPPEMMLSTENEVDIYNTSYVPLPNFGATGPTGGAGPSSGAVGATGLTGPTGPPYIRNFPNFYYKSGYLTINNSFFNSFRSNDNSCYLHRLKNYSDPGISAEPKILTIRDMVIPFGTYTNFDESGIDLKIANTSYVDIIDSGLKYNKTPANASLTDFLDHYARKLGPRNTEDNVTYIILTSCKAIPHQHIEGPMTYFTVRDIVSRQPYLPFDVPAFIGRRASKRPIFNIDIAGDIRSIRSQRISIGSKRKPVFYATITGNQLNMFNELKNKIRENLSICSGEPYLLTPNQNVVVFFKRKIDLVRKHLMTLLVRESNGGIFIEEICKDRVINSIFLEKAFNRWIMDKIREGKNVYAVVDPEKGNLLDNINKYSESRGFTPSNFISQNIQNIIFSSPRIILKYTGDDRIFNLNQLNSTILIPIIKNIPGHIYFIQNTEESVNLFIYIIKTLAEINKIEDQDQITTKCIEIINYSPYYRGVNVDLFNIQRISEHDSVSNGFAKLARDWTNSGDDAAFMGIFETKMTELLRYFKISIPDHLSVVNVRKEILEYIMNVNRPENVDILEEGYFSAREPVDEFRNIYYISVPSDSLNNTPRLKNALVQSMNKCFGDIYGQNIGEEISMPGYMVYLFYTSRSHVGMNPEFFMSVKQTQQNTENGQSELNAYIYNVCRSGKRRIRNFVRNCILKWVNDNRYNYNNIYLGVELLKQPSESIFNLLSLYTSCQIGTIVEITTNIETNNGAPASSLCIKMKREDSIIDTPENVKNTFRTFLAFGYIVTFFEIIQKYGIDSIESLTLINFINEISTQNTPNEIVEFVKEKLNNFFEIFKYTTVSVDKETISSKSTINSLLEYIKSIINENYPEVYQKLYDKLHIFA